jgi:carboxymethylenebutenolidase
MKRLRLGFLSLTIATVVYAAPPAVDERAVEYAGGEGEMPARLYAPMAAGRFPGVLVLHSLAGPGQNVEAFARRLAAEGLVAMTPDFFALHDFGPDGRTDHPLIAQDLAGALRFLASEPRVNPDRIGVVGFSFGGRQAVLLAATHREIRVAVVYYAVASHRDLGREVTGRARTALPLTDRVGAIHAPIQIHHGEADANVPVSQAYILHRALQSAGKPVELHTYPGADHLFDFALAGNPTHHPAAAALAWQRTLAFLRRHL